MRQSSARLIGSCATTTTSRFGLHLDEADPWSAYVVRLANFARGISLDEGRVADTFLVAQVAGTIVGRTSIRHELNEFLAREGGHIGYGVLPAHRRKGYATEILRQSLIIARSLGVERPLLICDADNAGSARVIETCGGQLETIAETSEGERIRRYWI